MSKAVYKRLGDYIREVNVRNRELKITKPMGINIEKYFMPSVANTIGTDLSNYKLVGDIQFACNLKHVGRDKKIPMAMHKGNTPITVSPAYFVFENKDPQELLSDYLMMWFKRPEFDRNAWFYTDVRGGMVKEALLDMLLPVPSIARQREIMAEYETLSRRICLNEQMIERLEATAQALYRKMFVDNIEKEDLPEGWRMGMLGDVAFISSGKTCSDKMDKRESPYIYPVAGASGIIGYSSLFNGEERVMTTGRVGTLGVINKYKDRVYMADNVLVIKSQYYEFCYQTLNLIDYNKITKGGVQSLITQTDLKAVDIIIPDTKVLIEYENTVLHLLKMIETKQIENLKLTELQSLLLAKMGQ